MKKITTPIIALIVAAGVAACGNSTAGNSSTGNGSTTPAASGGAATATTPSSTSGSAKTKQKQVATQAEQTLTQLSNTTTQLANGKITLAQAKPKLRQLHSRSLALVQNAKGLAPTSPTRTVVSTIGKNAAAYTHRLANSPAKAQSRQALRQSAKALSNLEAQTRAMASQAKTPSLNQITSDLQTLQRQATG